MLPAQKITDIADELAEAERSRSMIPRLTARNPDMTVEDSYAVQNEWRRRGVEAGRRLVGRKIGLTSKVMQVATGITEALTIRTSPARSGSRVGASWPRWAIAAFCPRVRIARVMCGQGSARGRWSPYSETVAG